MSTASSGDRDDLIDAVRALSVIVVVIFHAGLWRVTRQDSGWVARTMDLGPWGWYLSWVLLVMPLFFVCGGFVHALAVDKMHARGTTLAHFLANRGRRLVGPLVVFVTIFAVPSTVMAWLGHREQAVFLSHNLTKLLWFLVAYLLTVLLAPTMVALHERSPWMAPLALVALATAVDWWAIRADDLDLRYLNLAFVWLACHQLGIAYQRGFLRRGPRWQPLAAIGAGVAGIVILVNSGWPLPALGMGERQVSNLQPPTVAMVALCLAQTGVLGLVARRVPAWLHRPGVQKNIGILNALLMTIYLWHMPCVVVAFAVFMGLGMLVPAAVPVLTLPLVTLLVAVPLMVVVIPRLARLDLRMIPPLGQRQHGPLAAFALGLLTVCIAALWRHGLVLHPAEPVSSLGLVGVWVGGWLLARASDWRRTPETATAA